MDFGKLISDRRKALGLTLEQVGNACGVGKSTVRKWEKGMIQDVGRNKIRALANVLQIDPTQLIDLGDDATPARPADTLVLSNDEIALVKAYRAAEPTYQIVAMDILVSHKKVSDTASKAI